MGKLNIAVIFCLTLIGLNFLLYTQLTPSNAQNISNLPSWDIFERPNLEYQTIVGQWQILDGQAINQAQESLALQQRPVSSLGSYQLIGNFHIKTNAKAGLVFNAQSKGKERYHSVTLQGVGQTWLLTAGYVNSQGNILEQRRTLIPQKSQRVQLSLSVGWKQYQVELNGVAVLKNIPLAYRGGFAGIWAQGKVAVQELLLRQTKSLQEKTEVQPDPSIWNSLGGSWSMVDHLLEQRHVSSQDLVLIYQKALLFQRVELEVLVTQGAGVGLILAPSSTSLKKATLLRFDESGNHLFWGRYNEQSRFIGVSDVAINKNLWHWRQIELVFLPQQTLIFLDGKQLVMKLPAFNSTVHLGLLCWQSQAQFQNLRLESSEGTQTLFSP